MPLELKPQIEYKPSAPGIGPQQHLTVPAVKLSGPLSSIFIPVDASTGNRRSAVFMYGFELFPTFVEKRERAVLCGVWRAHRDGIVVQTAENQAAPLPSRPYN